MDDTTADGYVPTLPVNSESSFLVAPKPLSASQKVEYQSVDLVQSISSLRQPEVPYHKMCSSGTATNINTPRSDMASSHDVGIMAPTPESERIGNMRRTRPPPRRRRSSSPDVIAVTSDGRDKELAEKPQLETASVGDAAPDGHVLDAEFAEQQADDDSDFDVAPEPVKSKRQRGRPKKNAMNENTKKSSATAVVDAGTGLTDIPKKRRGRPKKAKQPTEAEQKRPGHSASETAASASVEEPSDVDAAQGLPEEDKTGPEETDQAFGAGAPKEEATGSSNGPNATEERGEANEVDRGTVEEARDKSKMKGSSWLESAGKPVYRVGLSKRLRIAPLLKSLPK
ncbi:hypothetical protein HRG_007931 [Hirsutella rhossiliensis]|uniref:AT hook domain-containing protein n=1 Tax=Hirsutella rhossiliensis TaxID=111463 RepID=A0A9P8MR85_9HYPO|nr:uncharacterized protein HRG_07931 [Hirsutella rhossiliensis]KAH0960778.1 hypothetical protein HRG_07931 [Hirsutella rhossiliensis]